MPKKFDIVWIGTGQATGTIIPKLIDAGKTVAIAEGGKFGGSCVNTGCTPTKALVASARAAHIARRGPVFGVHTGKVDIDFKKVMKRQEAISNDARKSLKNWLQNLDEVEIYPDYAEFVDSHTVRVNGDLIEGETIVINAGARPRPLSVPGIEDVEWLDNIRLLRLKELPQHLMIIGGGYISLEFAQVFRRFGSAVTILQRGNQIISHEDEDIAAAAQEILESEGIDIKLNAQVQSVSQSAKQEINVFYTVQGQEHQINGSHLLVAIGREPDSARLNLEAAGVKTDDDGHIMVKDNMQTSVPHIFALGDINGEGGFTHTSVNDGQIFWDHYSGKGDRKLSDRIPTYALFIDPPLGRAGISEKEARQSKEKILMATLPMNSISRAKEKSETAGLVKILVDGETEQIVGAAILGVGGDEVINMITTFMYTKQSYKVFQKAVLIHPTISEMMPFILNDLEPL